MKPPILRRFLTEDYPDAPGWFGRFLSVLNQFMEQTVLLFDKNVSLGDNIQYREYSSTFVTDAAYATGTFEAIRFSWTGAALPKLCQVSAIARADGTPILTSVGVPSWRYDNKSIVVSYIPGLAASTKYVITLIVI